MGKPHKRKIPTSEILYEELIHDISFTKLVPQLCDLKG
jgi:hypothetical protein